MSNGAAVIRSLLIYSVCLPLAIFLGYLLAVPFDFTGFTVFGLLFLLLIAPLLLQYHHFWLIACWNVAAVIFFLPGRPYLWLVLAAMSFVISILQHTLNRNLKFLHAPSIARPLIFMVIVVLITARLTGGMGLRALGGDVYGGKRYFVLLGAIVGYFALISQRIPIHKAGLYVACYFLGALTAVIAHLAPIVSPSLYFVFLLFPVDTMGFRAIMGDTIGPQSAVMRLGGFAFVGTAVFCAMLARYGIEGIFTMRKPWRAALFVFFVFIGMLGGFRSAVITLLLTFAVQFYLEGLLRSRLLPVMSLLCVLTGAVLLTFTQALPLSIQRSLSFLPIEIDPVARIDAQSSTEWRLQMWRNLLPEVPRYLLIGKGYAFSGIDLEQIQSTGPRGFGDSAEGSALAGDYHNGPLSVIVPFGIFGTFAFLWFAFASLRALHRNYLYGDPELKKVNTFLLAFFAAKVLFFLTIFGSLYSDMAIFAGAIGLSISLNGGIRGPAPAPAPEVEFNRFHLARAEQ